MGRTRRTVAAALAAASCALFLWPGAAQAQEPPAEPPPGGGAAVQGTLNYDDNGEKVPAEGVSITVTSADGSFTQSVDTDVDGKYRVDLPAGGDYKVEIDPDTLPKGVSLVNEGRTSLTLTFEENRVRPALFPLTSGGGGGGGDTTWKKTLRLTVEGIRFGLVIAVCAIGLSLIFGTTGLVNFAHGEMVTFGALIAYFFNQTMGWNLLVAAPFAIAAGALLGGALDRGLWRPLRNRGTGLVAMLVISIGVGILLRNMFLYQFGGGARPYKDFQLQKGIDLGPITIVPRDLVIIGLSILLLVGVASFLQFTRLGKAMRAVADDKDLAESSGIDVERVIFFVWVVGGALAAIGGIFQALDQQVNFQFGFQLLLLMFAGVTLGGLGTAYGALVGSVIIGLFIQLSTLVIDSEFKTAAALLVLILVLIVRPQGILGQAERVG